MTELERIRWRQSVLAHPDGAAWLSTLVQAGHTDTSMMAVRPPWEPQHRRLTPDERDQADQAARAATRAEWAAYSEAYGRAYSAAVGGGDRG